MALIPPAYLNSVISIGESIKNEKDEPIFKSLATGFLVGKPIGEKNEKGQQSYRLFVVTNRHVFSKKKRSEIMSKIRSKNTKVERIVFSELKKKKNLFSEAL